jgi:hypothetical protein
LVRLYRFETKSADRSPMATGTVSETEAATPRTSIAALSCAQAPFVRNSRNSLDKQMHKTLSPGNRAGVNLSSRLAANPAFASNLSQFLFSFYYL